jgi:N-acetylglucosamine kinase-like BadF-type ATPase
MGVDGGATKTDAAVLDIDERVIWLGQSGPSNPDAVGPKAATEALVQAADSALNAAGISKAALAAAVLAIAGTDTAAVSRLMPATDGAPWIVVNDVVGAWAASTGATPGVAAIAGTGSNVFGVGPGGDTWRAGGWGHILGDEGSGYWLGLESIRAALHERDGSGPATMLTAAAIRFFQVDDVDAVASMVYSKPLSKRDISAFSVETCEAAMAGDAVAQELYLRAADDLVRQISAVVRHTNLKGDFVIGLIGGAFRAGPIYLDPLAAAVHRSLPSSRESAERAVPHVRRVTVPPVAGCILLACHVAGRRGAIQLDELERLLSAATHNTCL